MADRRALENLVASIEPLDGKAMAAATERQTQLTKPPGALGRLEELSVWLAGVCATPRPRLRDKVVVTAAADHGVAQRGVSAYPPEVTGQMVLNFLAGGAAVNVLARQAGARVIVVDAGVATELPDDPRLLRRAVRCGTDDLSEGPAMSLDDALACVLAGAQLAAELSATGASVFAVGEMGIGNTTAAAAISAAITGTPPAGVTGRGTGVNDERFAEKLRRVEQALAVNAPDRTDGIDVLAKVGGLEIGFLAGVCLGAAAARRPIVLDGYITGAAALIAVTVAPAARQYMLASHRSAEPGHRVVLEYLQLEPLLDLGLRLGEGTGALLGITLLDSAARVLDEMATFAEAGVSGSDEAVAGEG